MPKLLVLFHSHAGATAALADAIAEGARKVRFTEVDVRRVKVLASATEGADADVQERLRRYRELEDVQRLSEYDALALGTPVRNGSIAPEIQLLLDRAAELAANGALTDRVATVFTSGSVAGDEGARAHWAVLTPLAAMGMLLVPPGRSAGDAHTSPLGVSASGEPGEAERTRAFDQGVRLARVAEWVRHAKGHEAAAGGHHHHHHHHH